jgi:hypothetical protein
MSLEDDFAALVESRLNEAEAKTGHIFRDLRELIKTKGALRTAKLLLRPSSIGSFPYGFRVLAAHNLLSHSIEQAAIDSAASGLFTEDELQNASTRLTLAKMMRLGR